MGLIPLPINGIAPGLPSSPLCIFSIAQLPGSAHCQSVVDNAIPISHIFGN